MAHARSKLGAVLAGAILAVLLPAGPAAANSYDYKLSAAVTGASGYAWFDFQQGRYGGNFTPSVSDNKCDGHPVYISVYTNGGLWQKFVNSKGCGNTQSWGWRGFTYKPNQPAATVKYVYVKVCVDDNFDDTCQTSSPKYNPYA
jgi:hypothetical protein